MTTTLADRARRSLPQPAHDRAPEERLATFLGWFSIGLGLAEVVAPRGLARLIGVNGSPTVLRAFGLREMAAGVGILTTERPAGWVWARVAGDALDLAYLGSALAQADENQRGRVAAATAAVAGVTALDVICALRLGEDGG